MEGESGCVDACRIGLYQDGQKCIYCGGGKFAAGGATKCTDKTCEPNEISYFPATSVGKEACMPCAMLNPSTP